MAKKKKLSKRRTILNSGTATQTATASKKSGFWSKLGGLVKKIAPTALKLIPGVGPVIGDVAEKVLSTNDPWFWQHVPGQSLATNVPLGVLNYSTYTGGANGNINVQTPRASWMSIRSSDTPFVSANNKVPYVIDPTDDEINTYLLPGIREVLNAIPLQSVDSYSKALKLQATMYALWRNLKKWQFLAAHMPPEMLSPFNGGFPILASSNAAFLDANIRLLEDRLKASVRLPHVLCEYLAWRYGRVFRSNHSAKSGLVTYDVLDITTPIGTYSDVINALSSQLSGAGVAQASVDIFNTYRDHDQSVIITDDTQLRYDAKEFCLRTNLDIKGNGTLVPSAGDNNPDVIIMDSNLDNAETYMASTVSTLCVASTSEFPQATATALFPVRGVVFYAYQSLYALPTPWAAVVNSNGWYQLQFDNVTITNTVSTEEQIQERMLIAAACKNLDVYNMDVFVRLDIPGGTSSFAMDLTAISIDSAYVTNDSLYLEQKLAFANLMFRGAKQKPDHKAEAIETVRHTEEFVESVTK